MAKLEKENIVSYALTPGRGHEEMIRPLVRVFTELGFDTIAQDNIGDDDGRVVQINVSGGGKRTEQLDAFLTVLVALLN